MVIEFLDEIKRRTQEIYERFKDKKPLTLSIKEEYLYQEAERCWICEKPFHYGGQNWKKIKVRDHDHFTGEFRGAAHNGCNLMVQYRMIIPVIAHNLSKYDLKLFIRDLMKYTDGNPNVIAKSSEEFITVSIKVKVNSKIKKDGKVKNYYYPLKFIDSLKFLSALLDKLMESSKSGCDDPSENFPILKKYFPNNYELLLRKGVYPYEYFTDYTKMLEKELPSKEAFYSKLRFSGIKDEEYQHAQNVYKTFNCKNLEMYTGLYCLSDVLQLADIWQVFIKETNKTYGLDPGHYVTLPSLSWDAMLKYTNASLELISDPTLHQCIERSIRGGISMKTKRYAHANNKYLPETYDPTKPSIYLMYFDKNNLYGNAMSQPLPVSGFRFATEEEILNVNTNNLLPGFL